MKIKRRLVEKVLTENGNDFTPISNALLAYGYTVAATGPDKMDLVYGTTKIRLEVIRRDPDLIVKMYPLGPVEAMIQAKNILTGTPGFMVEQMPAGHVNIRYTG